MFVNQEKETIGRLKDMAKRMRKMALDMSLAAGPKGAHIGGGFSCMEIMAVLYGEILNVDAENPCREERDRLLISKNHCTIAHFPALVEKGYFLEEELNSYSENGSRLIGYPYNPSIGLEYSGGEPGDGCFCRNRTGIQREEERPAAARLCTDGGWGTE